MSNDITTSVDNVASENYLIELHVPMCMYPRLNQLATNNNLTVEALIVQLISEAAGYGMPSALAGELTALRAELRMVATQVSQGAQWVDGREP
jgi:hypothetical protein